MTNDIRYVVLSDMHLGQDQSVLTALDGVTRVFDRTAPMLGLVMDSLAELIGRNEGQQPVTLILMGDILELAFAELHESGMVFERFASLWQRDGRSLFNKVVYMPGNHDHHLWEFARGSAYIESLRGLAPGAALPESLHTTGIVRGVPGGELLFHTLLKRALGALADDIAVEVVYPNYALRTADKDRMVLLHHGHFFESIYYMMTTLLQMVFPEVKKPETVSAIEKENFGWIDFFWSMLGHQGLVGEDVERIYDVLPYPHKLEHLVKHLADGMIGSWHAGHLEKWVAREALEKLIEYYFGRLGDHGRRHPGSVLSDSDKAKMGAYLAGPLHRQVVAEMGGLSDDLTVIFGHTHKPFEAVWDFAGFADRVKVYNTGGWAIDPATHIQPLHGGAAVLMSENLDAASVRFFTEHERDSDYRVEVAHAGERSAFAERLAGLVDADAAPYRDISTTAAAAVKRRFEVLASEIHDV